MGSRRYVYETVGSECVNQSVNQRVHENVNDNQREKNSYCGRSHRLLHTRRFRQDK